jgi:hypothetical protein
MRNRVRYTLRRQPNLVKINGNSGDRIPGNIPVGNSGDRIQEIEYRVKYTGRKKVYQLSQIPVVLWINRMPVDKGKTNTGYR